MCSVALPAKYQYSMMSQHVNKSLEYVWNNPCDVQYDSITKLPYVSAPTVGKKLACIYFVCVKAKFIIAPLSSEVSILKGRY